MTHASFEFWLSNRLRVGLWASFGVVLALVSSCAPAWRASSTTTTSAPLVVPPLRSAATSTDPLSVRFTEGASPPSGCFGLSRRTGTVACLVGQYQTRSAWGERHLSLLSNAEDAVPDVPIHVRVPRAGSGIPLELDPSSLRTLDAIMVDGDFITLGPATAVPIDSPRVFGKLLIELRREEIGMRPDTTWDVRVVVRTDSEIEEDAQMPGGLGRADGTDVLLANTLTSVACQSPSLSIRVLEPTIVLLERECRVEADGQVEVMLGAWICDSSRSRCD